MKKPLFEVPEIKKVRVIIDTDCNCECDDQYAVIHALMTPKFNIKAVIAEQYGTMFDSQNSMEESYKEIQNIVGLAGLTGQVNILRGGEGCLPDEKTPLESEGARFIADEAMKEDSQPLFVVNQGALTNMASACLMEPEIAKKITCIWIGGGPYPTGGWEFNLQNDIHAANVVMNSGMEIWQVPMNVYSMMKVSFSELFDKVYPYGEIGKYLVENTLRVNQSLTEILVNLKDVPNSPYSALSKGAQAAAYPGGESWQLGDSPVVGLMLTDHAGHYTVEGAPYFNQDCTYTLRPDNPNKIRVYNYVDSHFILEDFFAKLKYHFG